MADMTSPGEKWAEMQAKLAPYLNKTSSTTATPTNSTTTNVSSPTSTAALPQVDTTSMINKQVEAQKAAQAAQLQAVRDKAVSGYTQKIAGLDQTYRPLKDQQDFQYNKGVQGTNERLANMGIYNSGDMISAQVANNAANQNALNSLNQQQQNDKTNFENLIAQANNDYNTGLASVNAGIDAQALQSLINQANADRSYNYQANRDTIGDSRYNQQYADQRGDVAFNNNLNVAGLTGMYNGQQTMQGQQNAASLTGQNLANQTAQTNLQYLPQQLQAALQGQTLNNQNQQIVNQYLPQQIQGQITGQDLQNQNQAIVNQYLPQQIQAQLTGTNLQNDYQTLVNNGYPAQQAAQLAQINANIRQGDEQLAISRSNANTSASNAAAQLAWSKDPNNPDNLYKMAQINSANEKSAGTPTYKDTLSNAQKLLGTTDSMGNKSYSNDQIVNYIKYSSLSDEEKVQVLNQLGIPNN